MFITFGLVKDFFTFGLVTDVFYLWSCYRCLILPLVLLEMFNLPLALLQMFC